MSVPPLITFTLVDTVPAPEPDDLPRYSDPSVIVAWINPTPYFCTYRYEVEVYHSTGCVHWIEEGEGIDYWIDQHIDLELPGYFIITGIVGSYHRGDGWTTDDDVDWTFGEVRRASAEEIEGIGL